MFRARFSLCLLLLLIAILIVGCAGLQLPEDLSIGAGDTFPLMSPVFTQDQTIPQKYTCDGDDISPPLEWSDQPRRTESYAIIMEDPDAPTGTWIHWVLFNIPASSLSLPEAVPLDPQLADGSLHGKNSWRWLGYGGPCPPSGTHRYVFTLYALDTMLDLPVGITAEELLQAIDGHVRGQAELTGTYTR